MICPRRSAASERRVYRSLFARGDAWFATGDLLRADRDGFFYFVDRGGTTVVIKQGDNLDILAKNKLDDAFDASPVAVGRQLFLRGEKYLYCIEDE